MPKDYLHKHNDTVSPYEFIERDLDLHGDDYLLSLDNSEFLLNYGITRDEFLNEFSIDYSDFTHEKLISKKKIHPFNEQSFEKLVEGFKNESVKLLTKPKISSEGSNRRSRPAPAQPRTSVRPSEVRKRAEKSPPAPATQETEEIDRGFKPVQQKKKAQPRPAPYPAPQAAKTSDGPQATIRKEYKNFVKNLLRSSRSPLAKRRVNLHNKAFKNALVEEGIQWGSETWTELLLKFFPGTDPSLFSSNNDGDDQQKKDNINDGDDSGIINKEENGDQSEVNSADSDSSSGQAHSGAGAGAESGNSNSQAHSGAGAESEPENRGDNSGDIVEEGVDSSKNSGDESSKGNGDESEEGGNSESNSSNSTIENSEEGGDSSPADSETYKKEEINFTAEDSAGMASSFGDNKALEHVERFKKAGEQIGEFVEKDNEQLRNKLPEIEQPTGIERVEELPEKEELNIEEKEPQNDYESTGEEHQVTIDTKHELPILNPSDLSDEELIESKETPIRKDDVEEAIANLPIVDPSLNTDIEENLGIPLSGVNDLAQIENNLQSAESEILSEQNAANLESQKDFGENDIYPTIEKELLKPDLEITDIDLPDLEIESIPEELPQDVAEALNNSLEEDRLEMVEPEVEKVSAKKQETDKQQQLEIDNTLTEIDAETAKTRELQQKEQINTQDQVKSYQTEWQNENEQILSEFNENAETERLNAQSQIDKKITETREVTSATIESADQEIESEKEAAELEAQEAKDNATDKKRSWWQKALGAIGDFFDKVKEAITNVFNALRQKVNQIIEDAKKIVSDVIDAASNFIKGAIRLFGTALKGLVSIALIAFPKVAKRINKLIDKGVELACKAVDFLAEKLKETVNLLLDALGVVLDTLLAVLHTLINAALEYYKIFTKLVLMYIQRMVQMIVGILLVVGSIVILAAIISGGGVFGALWKSIEGKPELQRTVLKYVFDAFERVLDTIPPDLLGPLSTMFIHMMRGFISKTRIELLDGNNGQNFDKGLQVLNKFANIATGQDGDFIWSFIKNIFIGIWDSIKDIFIGVWDLLKFIWGIPAMVIKVVTAIKDAAPAIKEMLENLFGNAKTMIEEFMKDGPGFLEKLAQNLTPEKILAFFESMKEKIATFSYSLGEKVGDKFVTFMLRDDATSVIGEKLGKFTGMVIFEVLLAVFTAGIASAVKWGLKAAKPILRVASKIGKGASFLGKLGRIFIRGLKTIFGALKKVVSKIKSITQRAFTAFKGFIDNLLSGLGKILGKLGIKMNLDHKQLFTNLKNIKDGIEKIQGKVEFLQGLKGSIDTAITNKILADLQPSLEKYSDKYDVNKLYAELQKEIMVNISLLHVADMLKIYSEQINNDDDSGLGDEAISSLIDGCIEQVKAGAQKAMDKVGVSSDDQVEMLRDITESANDSFYDGMPEEITFYVAKFLFEKLSDKVAEGLGGAMGDKLAGHISDSDSDSNKSDDDTNSNDSEESNNEVPIKEENEPEREETDNETDLVEPPQLLLPPPEKKNDDDGLDDNNKDNIETIEDTDLNNDIERENSEIEGNKKAPDALNYRDRKISDNPAVNKALQDYIASIEDRATDIRVNQEQVNANGEHVDNNRPDLQYTIDGKRYYVEFERNDVDGSRGDRVLENDTNGNYIKILVDDDKSIDNLNSDDRNEQLERREQEIEDLKSNNPPDIDNFDPQGIDPDKVDPLIYEEMLNEYDDSLDPDKKKEFLNNLIKTGADDPSKRVYEKGQELYKIVPKDESVSPFTPFWMTKDELDAAMKDPNVAQTLGLPLDSHAAQYDVYKIVANEEATVFESKVAPTTEGNYETTGGGTQSLVIDRTKWSEAEKIDNFVPPDIDDKSLSPNVDDNKDKNDVKNVNESFNSQADPVKDVLGPGRISHKAEWDSLIKEFEDAGGEMVYRENDIAYGPSPMPGKPGQIIISPDASITALKHEFQHFKDDQEAGYRGYRDVYNSDIRITTEYNAYMVEINEMLELGELETVKKLKLNFQNEVEKIINLTGEPKNSKTKELIEKIKNI